MHATFLELDISIRDNIFVYKLFDKRDEFPFEIVRMPDLRGNIPDHIFYGSFMAEIIRICRATLFYEDFLPKAKQIFTRMRNQGGVFQKLTKQITKATEKYPKIFSRYNKTSEAIIFDISD